MERAYELREPGGNVTLVRMTVKVYQLKTLVSSATWKPELALQFSTTNWPGNSVDTHAAISLCMSERLTESAVLTKREENDNASRLEFEKGMHETTRPGTMQFQNSV